MREKSSAEQDLISHGTALKKRQLQGVLEGKPLDPPIATLLFSCVGRGSNLHSKVRGHTTYAACGCWSSQLDQIDVLARLRRSLTTFCHGDS